MANLYNLQDKNPTVDSITFADGTKQETASSGGGELYAHNITIKKSNNVSKAICVLYLKSNEPLTITQFFNFIIENFSASNVYLLANGFNATSGTSIIGFKASGNSVYTYEIPRTSGEPSLNPYFNTNDIIIDTIVEVQ